jgi:hypothetical protein
MQDQVLPWKGQQTSDEYAKLMIYDAFIEEQLVDVPEHIAPFVHKNYFDPPFREFAPRTHFRLHNAFTAAFKQLDPIS